MQDPSGVDLPGCSGIEVFKVMFSAHDWKGATKVSKTIGENGESGSGLEVFPLISNKITLRCLRITTEVFENQLVLHIPSVCVCVCVLP